MNIFAPGRRPADSISSFRVSISLRSRINFLILAHLLLFVLYLAGSQSGLPDQSWLNSTLDDFIKYRLTVSSNLEDIAAQWGVGIFTYQFIHFSGGELLLSVSMLWLFGHILQSKIGTWRVILLYFGFSLLSALLFYASHLVFPIFSGPNTIMYGAFGGVLGVMSTTVFLYGKHRLQLNRRLSPALWQIFAAGLLLSFVLVYENNMAYIIVYIGSIYAGCRYAQHVKAKGICLT